MTTNAAHLALLRRIANARIPFVTIGSAAEVLKGREYKLPDVDILLHRRDVEALVALLGEANVTVWGEPFKGAALDGKFYARANVDGVQLDATYEKAVDIDQLIRDADFFDGIPVCPEPALSIMNRLRD